MTGGGQSRLSRHRLTNPDRQYTDVYVENEEMIISFSFRLVNLFYNGEGIVGLSTVGSD